MTQFVEQLRNQAKWYAQPGHNARDLMDSRLLEKAADEIERMREWIHEEGERNNICTYNILGEVCGYCECKRKGKVK